MTEEVYKATSLNIAIQNRPDAGQPVPHLHVHIIPDAKVTSAIEVEVTLFYEMMGGGGGQYREVPE